MKSTFLFLTLLTSLASYAQETRRPLKACVAEVGHTVFVFEVFYKDDGLEASVTSAARRSIESARIYNLTVQPGLNRRTDTDQLNVAEKFIVQSMWAENNSMSSGIDLSQVRAAKIYEIGPSPSITAIVEARDGENKNLGSFLAGPALSPCN